MPDGRGQSRPAQREAGEVLSTPSREATVEELLTGQIYVGPLSNSTA